MTKRIVLIIIILMAAILGTYFVQYFISFDALKTHRVQLLEFKQSHANLLMIAGLKNKFPGHIIGYSDHTEPGDMDALLTATLLGATIIEKHFTHDKTLPGNDHYHAMDQKDLFRFWERIEEIRPLLGSERKHSLASEASARLNARRSLVARQTIPANSQIDESQLTWKRPGNGISPKDIDHVIGRRTTTVINADDLILWDMLER